MVGEERAGRIGDLEQAGLGHLEDADLVGRPEPVLGRPQEPERGVPLALEVEDGVDEVLEGLGTRDRAVLGHVADEDDRDPVALGEVHQPQRRLADLADAAGRARRARRPSRSGPKSTTTSAGPLGPGRLDDPPDVVLGEDPDAARGRAGQEAEARRAEADLAAAIPRPWHTARRARPRVSPAAAWRRSVDLPIPGSPPTSTSEPGTRPPPRTRSSSSIPSGRRGRSASAMAARPTGAAAAAGGRGAEPGALGARRLADDRLDQACSSRRRRGTGPSQRRNDSPQDWQTKRLWGRAIARPPGGRRGSPRLDRGARLGSAVDVEARLRDPCRRRSSSRARTCRAGGVRRGRPRSCSG